MQSSTTQSSNANGAFEIAKNPKASKDYHFVTDGYYGPAKPGRNSFFTHEIPSALEDDRIWKSILLGVAGVCCLIWLSNCENTLLNSIRAMENGAVLIHAMHLLCITFILAGLKGICIFLEELDWEVLRNPNRKYLGHLVTFRVKIDSDQLSIQVCPFMKAEKIIQQIKCRWEDIGKLEISNETIMHHKCLRIQLQTIAKDYYIWFPEKLLPEIVDALNAVQPCST